MQVREKVHRMLRELLEDRLGGEGEIRSEVAEYVCGGQGLFAGFGYWGWRGAGGGDGPEVVRLCAALEMFHGAILVQDDVVDRAATRRGLATFHTRYDTGTALCIMNWLLCYAGELFLSCGSDAGRANRLRGFIDETFATATFGQAAELRAARASDYTMSSYRWIQERKSGRYGVVAPLVAAAIAAGAPQTVQAAYERVGLLVGEGRQIHDDVIDSFGDVKTTGKPNDSDILEGRSTFILARALEVLGDAERDRLRALMMLPARGEPEVREVRDLIASTTALAEAYERMGNLRVQAYEVLDTVPLGAEGRSGLLALVDRALLATAA